MRVALLLVAALLLPGVALAAAYERGIAAFDEGRMRVARIEFMNAVKADEGDARAHLMHARAENALGDGVAAQEALKKARALGLGRDVSRHVMAEALLHQGRPADALEELDPQAVPERHAGDAARLRGRAHVALGELDAATRAYDEALAILGGSAALWTEIARLRLASGARAGAIEAADHALALAPSHLDALLLRAAITRDQYGLAASLPWFDRALEIDPNHVPALLERAATYGELGRYHDLLADSRQVLGLDPSNGRAYFLQAALAARAGEYDLARAVLRRAEASIDGVPAVMLLGGALDYQLGNPARAIERLAPLLERQPHNDKARRLLAAARLGVGDAREALATIAPLAERRDAESYALTLAAEALGRLGAEEEAKAFRMRAAHPFAADDGLLSYPAGVAAEEGRPGEAPHEVARIKDLLAQGEAGAAISRAAAVREANAAAPEAHILLGDALYLDGRYGDAARVYRDAANLAFGEDVALKLAQALDRAQEHEAAAQVVALYLGQNPRSVPMRLVAAERYLAAGEWTAAILIYEDLRSRLGNNDAALLNNLAWAYAGLERYPVAIRLARHAWRLAPENPVTSDTLGWLLAKSGADRPRGLALLMEASQG
ncbi:MAG: tetratricopeptide repeat protein [Sphingomonadaceae bacterium]